MQQTSKVERPLPQIVDYSAARAKAIAWLGDRYLLAKPINRKTSLNHLRVVGGSYESSNDSVAGRAGSLGRLAVDGAG